MHLTSGFMNIELGWVGTAQIGRYFTAGVNGGGRGRPGRISGNNVGAVRRRLGVDFLYAIANNVEFTSGSADYAYNRGGARC